MHIEKKQTTKPSIQAAIVLYLYIGPIHLTHFTKEVSSEQFVCNELSIVFIFLESLVFDFSNDDNDFSS